MGHTTPLTEEERARIVGLLPSGMSCRQIADEVGRSRQTVSRVARDEGHVWGAANVKRAVEAKAAYTAEARAVLAARMHQEALRLLDELHRPYVAFSFGGKDNTYAEHQMAEPDVRAKRDLIHAAATASKAALDIDRHDNRSTDVDQAAGLIVQLVDSLRGDPDA